MKKYAIIALLVLALIAVGYLTFVMAVIEILIGAIFLGILAIALFGLWFTWKNKEE